MSASPLPVPASQAPVATIVLPCYNEQDHVLAELERITAAMDASGMPYEVLAIDDASTDGTLEVLHKAALTMPAVEVLPFKRNGGSGTARRIGTHRARGDLVVPAAVERGALAADRGRVLLQGTPAELRTDERVQHAYFGGGYAVS